MKKYLGNKRVIIFLIAPAMILISVMVLYPMLVLVVHSFTEWDGLNPATFNGISNYIKLFKDPIFYTGLKNGLIFAGLQALIQIPLATLLAFAVKHSGRIEKNSSAFPTIFPPCSQLQSSLSSGCPCTTPTTAL